MRKGFTRSIGSKAISLFVAVALILSAVPFSNIQVAEAADSSSTGTSGQSDWMKNLDDRVYVSHLTIPGSHQAAAFNPRAITQTSKGWAMCQDADFDEQLDRGLRAFDLRYKWVGGANPASWYLYHGEDSWHYELESMSGTHMDIFYALDKMKAWLEKHPSEFIIVNFQKEMGNAWTDTEYKNKILSRYGGGSSDNYANGLIVPYWNAYSWNQLTIGDVRGRIIDGSKFMQGVTGDYNDWNAEFNTKVAQMNRCFDAAPAISKSDSVDAQYNNIQQKVIYSNLAFNSNGATKNPYHLASEMRKYLFQYNVFTNGTKNGTTYTNRGQKAYGIVLYDFVTNDQNIINYNVQANDWARKDVYEVKFNTNGAQQAIATQNVQDGNGVDYPWTTLTKAGYTFTGWYTDQNCKRLFKFATNKSSNSQNPANQISSSDYDKPTGNMTLYAGWAKNSYNIKYVLNGGWMKDGATNPSTYAYGKVTSGFVAPEKTGYSFGGWYSDAECTKKVETIAAGTMGDITLYAKWSANTYKVTYTSEVQGYTNLNPTTFVFGSGTVALTDAKKNAFIFLGWYDQSGKRVYNINTFTAKDITLTAKWEQETSGIVYHNVDGVDQEQIDALPTSYSYSETEDFKLPTLSRGEHYTFEGWYADKDFTQPADTIPAGTVGSVERYAKWSVDSWTVTYDLGYIPEGFEESTVNPSQTSYEYGTGIETLEIPKKYGHTFLGWYTTETFDEGSKVDSISATETGEKTFYAKWESRQNTITYIDAYDNPNPTTFYYHEGLQLQEPKRDGYTFLEWSTSPVKIGDLATVREIKPYQTGNNITLYALWSANKYEIKYVDSDGNTLDNNGSNPTEYTVGTGINRLNDAPAKENMKFVGWFTDPTDTTTKMNSVSKDKWGEIKLIAVYVESSKVAEYSITYDNNGGKDPEYANPTTYITGYGVTKFNAPMKDNYDFAGWQDENNQIVTSIDKEKTGEVKLKATWTPKVFNVTYDTDGGSDVSAATYKYGEGIATLPTPTREHSEFLGWFNADGEKVEKITETDSGDFELFAHWKGDTFTIKYEGAEGVENGEYVYGTGLDELPTATKEHYTFDGWLDGDEIITSISKTKSGNLTLTAKWSPVKYAIKYELGGGEQAGNPEYYVYGEETEISNAPAKNGCTFKGWTINDGQEFTKIAAGTSGEVTLTANWGLNDYTIEYDYQGGVAPESSNPTTYRYSVGVGVLNSPSKENYDFEGWYIDGKRVTSIDETRYGNVTLVANWTAKIYEIEYDFAGGEPTSDIKYGYTYGEGVNNLVAAKRANYTFAGWLLTGTDQMITSIPNTHVGKVSLTATWTANTYKIEYELYGGKIAAGNPTEYTYGQGAVVTNKPTKANFTFGGWSYNGTINNDDVMKIGVSSSGNIKLYAHWIANTYSIKYDLAGGKEGSKTEKVNGVAQVTKNPTTYSYGEGVTELIDPVAPANKVFDGWYLNGKKVTSISATQSGTVTLVAKWVDSNPTVRLTSVTGEGSLKVNGVSVRYGSSIDVDSGKAVTISWKSAEKSNGNLTMIKSIKVNGVEQDASGAIDKTKWQTTNTDYKTRMKDSSNITMVTYDNVKNTEQSITLSAATLKAMNTDLYNVEVEFEEVAPVYRLYNMITSEHLFTTNKAEYDKYVKLSEQRKDYWIGEGIDWFASTTGTTVHRLYNAALGSMGRSSHYYTSDTAEIAKLKKLGWVDDGTEYQFASAGDVPIYTCYNELLGSAHHYTSSWSEWQGLKNHGWDIEYNKNGGSNESGVMSAVLSAK